MSLLDDRKTWQRLYKDVKEIPLPSAVTGFNVSLDRIIPVTPDLIRSPALARTDMAGLTSRLLESMRTCTADEWFVSDRLLYDRITRLFADTGSLVIGGQAGIAACSLAQLGAEEVFCLAPGAGSVTCSRLRDAGVIPLTFCSNRPGVPDTVHHVFEYRPGIVPVDEGVVPRSNRFIASPVHGPETVLLPGGETGGLIKRLSGCTRAFLSGYQYLTTDVQYRKAAGQIRELKGCNNDMRVHIECVTVSEPVVLDGMLRHIFPAADSIGMNERELAILVSYIRDPGTGRNGYAMLPPSGLVDGAVEVWRETGVRRVHVHTFGCHILVSEKQGAEPEGSLLSLLFASRVVSRAAEGKSRTVSPHGMAILEETGHRYRNEGMPGVFSSEDCTVTVVPACIAEKPEKTCGLGDILSSAAFVADRF